MAVRKKTTDPEETGLRRGGGQAQAVRPGSGPIDPSPDPPPGPPSAEGVLADTQAVVREALKNGDHRTALKGLEMLGKHFGLFGDRLGPEGTAGGQVFIYKIPDNGRAPSGGGEA